MLFYRVSSLTSGLFGPSVPGMRSLEIDLPPERHLMSPHDGSHPATEHHEPSIEGLDAAGPQVEADPERDVDGLIQDLGLAAAAAPSEPRLTRFDAAADEPETAMTDFSNGEPPPILPQTFESPALEQLDDLTTKLSALEGETEADSTDSLSAMRAELAAARNQIEADRQALVAAREALQLREAELNERAAGGADVESPAQSSHAAALQILEAEIVRRTAELNQQRRAIEKDRAALDEAQSNWRIEYKTQKETLETELQKFSTRQRMIRQEQAEWDKKSAEFNAERTRLREQKQILQQQAAELADERERVEMQAATILVGARVAEITVSERNEFATERESIQAEREKFAQLQRDVDEERAALAVQQRDLERQQQQCVEDQRVAREARAGELQTLEARLRDAEAALAEARERGDELNRRLELQTEELNLERQAVAEERSRWEASQQPETPAESGGELEAPGVAESEDESADVSDEPRLDEGEDFESQQNEADAVFDVEEDAVASDGIAETDVDTDRRESTPEERAAAAFRLLGIRPEDQHRELESPELPAIEDRPAVVDPAEASVLQTTVEEELEPTDDSAIRFARLRAEAMGTAASAPEATVREKSIAAEPAMEVDSRPEDDDRPIVPRVVVDKEEARENLRSLREVSQYSTQSALNLHQSKHLRNSIVMRSLTAFVCFAGAMAFLSGELAGYEMFWMQGTVFLVVGIYMAFDAFQKTAQLGVITARRRAGRRPAVAEAAPQESGTQPV